MITSNLNGDIFVWDLEERNIVAKIEAAHSQAITLITMLPGKPIFLTAGCDNSIKVFHVSLTTTHRNGFFPHLGAQMFHNC